jgi:peptide chain release factor 2
LRTVFDIEKKRKQLKVLEKDIQDQKLWQDKKRAIRITQEFNQLKQEISGLDNLKKEIGKINSEEKISQLENQLKKKEIEVFFSGKYDRGPAILSIRSGAGGQDAQDWATMILRMYERYCQRKGFEISILHQSFGEGGGPEGRIGTKSATLEIKGIFAFGFLKKENGVHRLVRISPFSLKKLRHTSFALVEVIPKIEDVSLENVEIKTEDLRVDFYRASGPGGQYVNKRETAVRITHLPTGITAVCQLARSQAKNREKAMELLYSRIYAFYQKKQKKELLKVKGERISASWGNQIRSYVLHPYKMVKDLRTGVETSNVEKVLDGQLEEFIEAEVKLKND